MTYNDAVQLVKTGNKEAFDFLYNHSKPVVYNALMRMTQDEDLAFDLMQDAFTKAYVKINMWREEAAFTTWVYTIAMNEARMYFRKANRHTVISLDPLLESRKKEQLENRPGGGHELKLGLVAATPDPANLLAIEQALATLKPKQQLIYTLIYREGLSIQEASEELGVSVPSLKKSLHVLRRHLMDILNPVPVPIQPELQAAAVSA